MTRHVLVTGSSGKTGRRLVERLATHQVAHRAASRRPAGGHGFEFDWTRPDTWRPALDGITAVYLVAPIGTADPASIMIDFVETAIRSGAGRFVLLSASLLEAGGPAMGSVHRWLQDNADDWTVLRPSWFMQNFSEGTHRQSIQDEGTIYSATDQGKVAFIDAEDIAEVAYRALVAEEAFNTDLLLTGPATLSYDDVARRIASHTGRPVTHTTLSFDELTALHERRGLAKPHAQTLALMDLAIAAGAEDRITDSVESTTGQPPKHFDDFLEDAYQAFAPTEVQRDG